ncbi:MAG: hypothetical protein HQM16_09530 [Deltaproteobacteria bacterium]|nr:hypothetical protein [Deltaproteobacteria bacterium]
MKKPQIDQLKDLKQHFKSLSPKDREAISICFLKVKLGVHHPDDFDVVTDFLKNFDIEINPDNLDGMMNYFHSSTQSLPEFLALEDSMSDIKTGKIKVTAAGAGLADYNPDDVETLKEEQKPLK